ncbi:14175_t:CDS:2 [Entrophospora sp. SA101]|nr:14175_t:CDS:2 [Entrophospora sp. SA101]
MKSSTPKFIFNYRNTIPASTQKTNDSRPFQLFKKVMEIANIKKLNIKDESKLNNISQEKELYIFMAIGPK